MSLHPHTRQRDSIMKNHTITIETVPAVSSRLGGTTSQDYQAKCSCGWVSQRAWLKATVRRAADMHRARTAVAKIA